MKVIYKNKENKTITIEEGIIMQTDLIYKFPVGSKTTARRLKQNEFKPTKIKI